MTFILKERPSDSALVETIWHAQIERPGSFISGAASYWEMVVTKYGGKTIFTVRGPEIRQIERARYAMTLLCQGTSILDTVYKAGYYDQSHMTNSLKRFLGQTPAQITHAIAAQ